MSINKWSLVILVVGCFGWQAISIAQETDQPRQPNTHDGIHTGHLRNNIDRLILLDDVAKKPERFSPISFGAETKFVSTASRVVGTHLPGKIDHSPSAIRKAAETFLETLSGAQRKKLLHELDSDERAAWTNLPARANAGGIRLGDLNEDQLRAVCDLMAHLLSQQGYEKMRLIMLADDQLLKNGQPRPGFGTEYFSVVLFGTPSDTEMWAFQLDGHHIGLNVTVHGKAITVAPSFIGTQPVSFELGGHTIQPMQYEIDAAFKLANMLTEQQFKEALTSDRRGRILSGPGRDGFKMKPSGLACSKMDAQQKNMLMVLIYAWVGNLPRTQAVERWQEVKNEIDDMHFSWNGPRKYGSDVSYVVQGPSLVIEFAYQDLGGDPLNHLHTQYRNPKNDYGKAPRDEGIEDE